MTDDFEITIAKSYRPVVIARPYRLKFVKKRIWKVIGTVNSEVVFEDVAFNTRDMQNKSNDAKFECYRQVVVALAKSICIMEADK